MTGWTVIIPVKRFELAKQRLALPVGLRRVLAEAFACDVIVTTVATPGVERVVVVTDEPVIRAFADRHGVHVLDDARPARGSRLNSSVMCGVTWAERACPSDHLFVVPADLPSIEISSLRTTLDEAAGLDRAFVADAEGQGTSLLLAAAPSRLSPRYGPGSAAAHRIAGYVELAAAPLDLRRDVDDLDALDKAVSLGVGTYTSAALRGAAVASRIRLGPEISRSARRA